ncbi:MAG: YceI family protein [Bacteroidota bacterium]
MNYILSLFYLLLSHGVFSQVGYGIHEVKVTESEIVINVETNVDNFKCRINTKALNDFILVKNVWSDMNIDFDGFDIKYSIEDFKCPLSAMTKDLRSILKADQQPYLSLILESIAIGSHNEDFEELDVTAVATISIAGVKRKISIEDGIVTNHSSASLTLEGATKILLTDFNIEPPTKFLGLIKIKDEVNIEFEVGMVLTSPLTKK